jgi:hypothetical protein
MKIFFILVATLTAIIGVLWTAFPSIMLAGWGVENPDEITEAMSQRAGVFLLGLFVTFSLASRSTPFALRTALLAGGAFTFGLLFIFNIIGAFSDVFGSGIWFAIVVELIVTVTFLVLLCSRRSTNP